MEFSEGEIIGGNILKIQGIERVYGGRTLNAKRRLKNQNIDIENLPEDILESYIQPEKPMNKILSNAYQRIQEDIYYEQDFSGTLPTLDMDLFEKIPVLEKEQIISEELEKIKDKL